MIKPIMIGIAVIGFVIGGAMIFQTVRSLGDVDFDQVRADAERLIEETDGDDAVCLEKSVEDLALCSPIDVPCQMHSFLFFKHCSAVAAPSPELCAEVPEGLVDIGLWTVDACPRTDVNLDICSRLMREVAKKCLKARDGTG